MTACTGFIGLGQMGLPMLARLARAGHALVAFDADATARRRAAELAAAGTAVQLSDTVAGLADCDIVILMLPDSPAVEAVVIGTSTQTGLADLLAPGSLLIDMGSSNPPDTQVLAATLSGKGIGLVDAPVSGSVPKAREGTLTIMVGGPSAEVERARPLLACLGETIIPTGRTGSAHAMKALNNYVYAAGLLACSEALLVARAIGLDPGTLVDVMNAASGRNLATASKAKQHMLSGSFDGGFALRLQAKDLRTALGLQTLCGFEPAHIAACAALWEQAEATLEPGSDNTAIYRFLASRYGLTTPAPAPAPPAA